MENRGYRPPPIRDRATVSESWTGSPGEYEAQSDGRYHHVGDAIGGLIGAIVKSAFYISVAIAAIKYVMSN